MDTLMDYIRWLGDVPISVTGLRDADAMILCVVSYFDLHPVFDDAEGPVYVRDCTKMIEEGRARVMITGKSTAYAEILKLAAASRRFGELRMSDYEDVIREEPPLQFSAVCFHDENDLSFLAYRGTDSTLAGWEEDFMISFMRTEAQGLALRYADAKIRPGRRWVIGGHSKGGNLALYAACAMSDAVWEQVERVYILDGPGLCPEVMDLGGMQRIEPRCRRIIPRFSVVGKLFEPKVRNTSIIQSVVSGFGQHSLASWAVDHGLIAAAEENDPRSLWINNTVNEWLEDLSQSDRVTLVKDLFEALAAGGAKSLEDFDDLRLSDLEPILRRFRESSETTKRSFNELAGQAVSAAGKMTEKFFRRGDDDDPEGAEEAEDAQPGRLSVKKLFRRGEENEAPEEEEEEKPQAGKLSVKKLFRRSGEEEPQEAEAAAEEPAGEAQPGGEMPVEAQTVEV